MQWQIEDAMVFALDVLDGERARLAADQASIADAERRVAEALAENRGR